jgi:hypothetical protein
LSELSGGRDGRGTPYVASTRPTAVSTIRRSVKAGPDGDDRLEQPAHPVPGLDDSLEPPVQLGEELVQLQVR